MPARRLPPSPTERNVRVTERMSAGTHGGRSESVAPPRRRASPDLPLLGRMSGGCGRAATIIIACSDASEAWKGCADFVLDGTADQVQFNQAIDDISALVAGDEFGGRILVSEGHVYLTGSITLATTDAQGITIEGQGLGTIFTLPASSGLTAPIIDIDATGRHQLRFFAIDGNRTGSNTSTGIIGIDIAGATPVHVLDVFIHDVAGQGIATNGDTYIGRCRIDNSGLAGVHCNGGVLFVEKCHIIQPDSGGVRVDGSASAAYILGNHVLSPTGIGIDVSAADAIIEANTISGATDSGIDVSGQLGSTRAEILGNRVLSGQQHGINVWNTSFVLIEHNLVYGNSQQTDNTYDGIQLETAADACSVQNNIVRHGGGAAQHRYGININNANCDGNSVWGNNLGSGGEAGKTADYRDVGTGTRGATDAEYEHVHGSEALSPESLNVTGGPVQFSGDISPAQITANQNDYNPTGLADTAVLRLSSDAARDITGLAGGSDGRIIILLNVGSFTITLKDESASSTAANRFALAADFPLDADEGLVLWYDSTSSRWRMWGQSEKGAAGGGAVATDTIWDAKGDLAVGTGADAASRLAVGTDTHVLTADSTQATGVKWAAAAAGGSAPLYTIQSKSAAYTAATGEAVLCDASGGGFTITLPTAVGNSGKVVIVKKIDSSGNAVTVDGNGAQTIDGTTTITLNAQWESAHMVSDGANWVLV